MNVFERMYPDINGGTVSRAWQYEFFPCPELIMIKGTRSLWDKTICYQSVGQTTTEGDSNPGGTIDTRRLARKLLELPEVTFVRLSKENVAISVIEGTTSRQASLIAQTAIDILIRLSAHDW